VGEGAATTESNKTWGNVTLTAKKLAALARITNELNEDSIINVADDLASEIAYAFSNSEDEAGFNGTGTSTYGGIVGVRQQLKGLSGTIANIAGLVVAAGNNYSEITLANFNTVISRLPQYADTPNAKWYMHKSFFHEVADRLSYAAGGTTVAEIGAKTSRLFLGYPVQFAQVLPKVEANDQVCALFGDLTLAAAFGDRRQTSIAFSESATVGGESVFERDQIAVRGSERVDISVHDVGNANADATLRVPGPIVGLITAAA
jgi:HK97 family phage major capsid protein